tara:strand:- start:40 stop:780 length:741 start_codon:yes stop_codon:yes gene_type:complete
MSYIGNTAGNRFVAPKSATQFSGDGSTTAFTLEHAVGSDEDILVSVDGVIQEPSVAYAVSSGTTLTFTAAPSSNSGNNIFVYYLFRTVGTVSHPSNNALTATSGTFSSNATVGGTFSVTGVHTIGTNAVATSEGGATTTNIVQGLAKTFAVVTNSGGTSTLQDSFNLTSITDGAAGITTFTFANDFSSANYAFSFGLESHAGATLIAAFGESASAAAGSIIGRSAIADGTATDGAHITLSAHGDLA